MENKNFFCATESKLGNDEQIGSASYFKKLILLEYRLPFKEEAFAESELPQNVKDTLNSYLSANEHTRLLLIRNPEFEQGELSIFGINNTGKENKVNRKFISSYEEILDIDLSILFEDNSNLNHEGYLYLVCTNGTKDKCCAKLGIPIYNEFKKNRPEVTWQCSHVGGDRFAPTMFTIPSCTNYGHLVKEDVTSIINHEENKAIYLDKLRGQAFLNFYEQAATYFLRKKLRDSKLGTIIVIESEKLDSAKFRIVLKNLDTNTQYPLVVSKIQSEYFNFMACTSKKQSYSVKYQIEELDLVQE